MHLCVLEFQSRIQPLEKLRSSDPVRLIMNAEGYLYTMRERRKERRERERDHVREVERRESDHECQRIPTPVMQAVEGAPEIYPREKEGETFVLHDDSTNSSGKTRAMTHAEQIPSKSWLNSPSGS